MSNTPKPPLISSFVLTKRLLSLASSADVTAAQIELLNTVQLEVVQDGIVGTAPVEEFANKLRKGVDLLLALRQANQLHTHNSAEPLNPPLMRSSIQEAAKIPQPDGVINSNPYTEEQATVGFDVAGLAGQTWRHAKAKVLQSDPELAITSYAYWANVRLRFVEMGGSKLNPEQSSKTEFDNMFIRDHDPTWTSSCIPQFEVDRYWYNTVEKLLFQYQATPGGFRWVLPATGLTSSARARLQSRLHADKANAAVKDMIRANNMLAAVQALEVAHNVNLFVVQKSTDSALEVESAHSALRQLMDYYKIAGAIAENDEDRNFIIRVMQTYKLEDNNTQSPVPSPGLLFTAQERSEYWAQQTYNRLKGNVAMADLQKSWLAGYTCGRSELQTALNVEREANVEGTNHIIQMRVELNAQDDLIKDLKSKIATAGQARTEPKAPKVRKSRVTVNAVVEAIKSYLKYKNSAVKSIHYQAVPNKRKVILIPEDEYSSGMLVNILTNANFNCVNKVLLGRLVLSVSAR